MKKKFNKKVIAKGLIFGITLGATDTIKASATSDISNDYFAKTQIEEFINEGIINGYPDGTFRPNEQITRAEFVKIINKAFGFTEVGEKSFKDVNDDAWYANDVKIAVEKGYINGFEDETFRPNEKMTREQMAKILGVILNVSGENETNFLDNSNIAPWAKKYIAGLSEKGIIKGYPDQTFNPKANTTRGEGVSVVYSGRDVMKENNQQTPSNPVVPPATENPDTNLPPVSDDTTTENPSTDDSINTEQPPATDEETVVIENPTQDKIDEAFKTTDIVKVTGNLSNINVPTGKTLVVSENATIENNVSVDGSIKVYGDLTLNSDLSIENGGTIDLQSSSSTYSVTEKIKGDGSIIVGSGTLKLDSLSDIKTNINKINKNSKIIINQSSLLQDILSVDDNTELNFSKDSIQTQNKHTLVVKGDLTVNKDFTDAIIKSTENANLTLKAKALLFENDSFKEYTNGHFTALENGNWEKAELPSFGEPETQLPPWNEPDEIIPTTINLNSSITDQKIVVDNVIDIIDVTTSSTTTDKTIVDYNNLDLNENNLSITIEASNDIDQIVLIKGDNEVELNLPNKVKKGEKVVITLTKEQLIQNNLIVDFTNEQELQIKVVEAVKAKDVEEVKNQIDSLNIQYSESGLLVVNNMSELRMIDTKVENVNRLYNSLSEEDKILVTNNEKLTKATETVKTAKDVVYPVYNAIGHIPELDYITIETLEESEELVSKAEKLYQNILDNYPEYKECIEPHELSIITTSRDKINRLKQEQNQQQNQQDTNIIINK